MSASLSLAQMADLALGTPELGAVNFNVLHTLLHAILQKLDLGNAKADIDKYDKDFLQAKKDDPETGSVAETDITDKDSAITGMTDGGKTSGKGRPSSAKSYPRAPYHALEDKVKRLEYQMQQLNDLPSNDELFEQTRGDGERPRPASDMWQQMQMKNKVDANEEGVSKLMSLVDDLMKEMLSLKDDNDKLKKQIEQASDVGDLLNRLKALEDRMNELNDKFSQLPSDEFYDGFVTWQALEDALKGLRTELEPQERVVIEMSQQTDVKPKSEAKSASDQKAKSPTDQKAKSASDQKAKSEAKSASDQKAKSPTDQMAKMPSDQAKSTLLQPSRPPSSRPATRQSTRPNSARSSTPGPSIDLAELLERLGKLSDQHDILEERVKVLEDEIKNKANKDALDALSVPDDLLNQLKDMADLLEQLKKNRDKLYSLLNGVDGTSSDTRDVPEPGDVTHSCAGDPEKLSSLEDKYNYLHDMIQNMESRIESALTKLNDKLGSLETDTLEEMVRFRTPTPGPTTPSDYGSMGSEFNEMDGPVKLGKVVDNPQLQVDRKALEDLQTRVKALTKDVNRALVETRDKTKEVEDSIKALNRRLTEIMEGKTDSGKLSDSDSDALSRMQQAILNLQAELERLSNVTQQLIDDNTTKQQHIDTLYETTKNLEENKADKEYVQSELEVKADKRHLDGKVNRSLFDNTCDDLNKMIQDILSKLLGHEDEWRKALAAMIEDLDGKLDRLEFGPIRDELERQLKALLRKLNGMHFGQAVDDDDAAGIRKQLIQKFHCISCDRPVDMVPTGPVPAIPQSAGMPATRSARPYTTFELEQIRQHAKSGLIPGKSMTNYERALTERQHARCRIFNLRAFLTHFGRDLQAFKKTCLTHKDMNGPQIDVMDLYATQRACGGSHTTTVPHRRITRMTHINNLFRDDTELMGPAYKEEQDIQGADGHIYRGRAQDKLPQLPQTAPPMAMQNSITSPRTSRKQMPVKPFTAQPPTPRSPRACSARQNRGGSAGKPSSRPQSAAGGQHTEVPTAGEIASPPPPPATSEMDPQDQGSLPLRTPTPGQTNGLDN